MVPSASLNLNALLSAYFRHIFFRLFYLSASVPLTEIAKRVCMDKLATQKTIRKEICEMYRSNVMVHIQVIVSYDQAKSIWLSYDLRAL
jgi:hypothetical protein